uniref:Protein kinase domain-containing protein n=1 Tax=Araucaria cunninghamii TaxID=56994 RepID=A0A0D6QU31_ARACU
MSSFYLIHIHLLLISCFFIKCCNSSFLVNSSPSYRYPSYQDCSPSTCGNSIIKFPFQIYTEGSQLYCSPHSYPSRVSCHADNTTTIDGYPYESWEGCGSRVLGDITESSYTIQTIRIAPQWLFDCSHDLTTDDCPPIRVENPMYKLSDKYTFGTILSCTKQTSYISHLQRVQCLDCENSNKTCFFAAGLWSIVADCVSNTVVVPADKNYNISAEKNLRQFLQRGFEINWNITDDCLSCEASGGRCYGDSPMEACICPDKVHRYNCSDGSPIKIKNKPFAIFEFFKISYTAVFWGIGLACLTVVAIYVVIICCQVKKGRRKSKEEEDMRAYMDPLDLRRPSVENVLQEAMPTRYSYAQVVRYTNNFAEKLGKGGFGTVYKGKLPERCLVAVKILDNSNQCQNQFMNEVATLGRIHHVHLVRLLGYCFQGSKKALLYEYMVNGSLEKYIYGDADGDGGVSGDKYALDWKTLHSIALGTARGIAYLHDECRSQIIHCDIKPHNVLLDVNFSPKVADFGLAKLADREQSHVSLTAARGTPGYVAPEVWFQNTGSVTDRCDVYSYGMLVMEMVGGRKNYDERASRSSKFYYPEWAYKQVEMGQFGTLREGSVMGEEDENIAKMLSTVGLWCIQYDPSDRPSMSRVVQILEGHIEISVPPFPFPIHTTVKQPVSIASSSSM